MPTPPPPEHARWKPGQSGNPAGSNRKQRLTGAVHRLLDKRGQEARFVKVGLEAALGGDFRFWSYLFDRVDGKMSAGEGADDGGKLGEILDEILAGGADPAGAGDVPR